MSLTGGELEAATAVDGVGDVTAIEGRSLLQIAWRRLKSDKLALAGGVVVILLVLVAIFANVLQHIYGQSYLDQHASGSGQLLDPLTSMPKGAFGGISGTHWLGVTPVLGQDVLTLLLFGARTSLLIAVSATILSLVLGVSLGLIAGYYGGWIDMIISRSMDVLLSFPVLLMSISLLTVLSISSHGASTSLRFLVIIFVLGFFPPGFPYIGRIVRGQVLSLREKEFVEASRSLGASDLWIMRKEIAPNLIGPILVYTTLTIPTNILGEAGLSFLGVGVQPPTPSWGQMLSDAGKYFQTDPAYLFLPGLAIFISVLAFNLLGDGLRDALDPKSGR